MKHGLIAAGNAVVGMLQRHPHRISAIVAALLLGGGGGAYAVAQLAPDASNLPVREVLEAVAPQAPADSGIAADIPDLRLYRSEVSRSTDTPDTLLQRLGVVDADAAAFLRKDPLVRQALNGRAGRVLRAETTERNELLTLSARWVGDSDTQFQRLVVERTPSGFASRLEASPLVASSRMGSGTIRSSLFAATDEAGIPDAVAVQIAEIFSGDIDFHRALRKDDRFSVVYEVLSADGEPLRAGRVLSAEFVNSGRSYQAVWYQEPGSRGGYYTPDGNSLRRAYLTSPMEFSRVTSGFKMRFHPILQKWRAHLGVDYAAPTGTRVRSVGDGVVKFAGVQNGFGNVVILRHANNHETVYAHLSRIGVRAGQRVSQGDSIGAVGATGWATGPHLHFEFRVNGVHQDPLTVARKSESVPITATSREAFMTVAGLQRLQLQAAASIQQASAD